MSKNYLPLLAFSTALLAGSCVDSEYDLQKEISYDVQVGGEKLTLPLGSSENVTLDKLIKTTDNLQLRDGQYYLHKEGTTDCIRYNINPFSISIGNIYFSAMELNLNSAGSYADRQVMASQPISESSSIVINEFVPDAILSLLSVKPQSSAPVAMTVEFAINNLPYSSDIDFSNLEISLPSFFELGSKSSPLALEGVFNPQTQTYTCTYAIYGLNFSGFSDKGISIQKNVTSRLIVDTNNEITISGSLAINSQDPAALSQVSVIPTVKFEKMNVAEISGMVNPEINSVHELMAIDLGSDLDFVKENATLDFHNPQIAVSISSNAGIPINVTPDFYATDAQQVQISGSEVNVPTLYIEPAPVLGEMKTSNFVVSRKGLTASENYTIVEVAELSNMLNSIPDYIGMNFTPEVNQESIHRVNLTEEMMLTGEYQVDVPLEFDQIEITYNDTIDNLKADLKDFAEKTDEVEAELTCTVKNAIPVELELSAIVTDSEGNVIPEVDVKVLNTIPAGTLQNEISQPVTVSLNIHNGTLKDIDNIIITIHGVSESDNQIKPLKNEQYLQMVDMKLSLIGGINLDLN